MNNRLAYSPDEARHLMGLGRTTIFKLIKEKKLRVVKCGSRTLIPAKSIEEFLAHAASEKEPPK